MASTYVKDEQGGTFIAASQRPDGTWRKQRRVKDGYIPQEEVPLYESKGKQFTKNKSIYPVGAGPEFIAERKAKREALAAKVAKSLSGSQVKSETKKKKKKNKNKNVESITEDLSKATITESAGNTNVSSHNEGAKSNGKSICANANKVNDVSQPQTVDPQKRLKNLRKKMREIESLEEKIKSGLLKNPEKEILDKMARKREISKEIKRLETNQ